MGETADSALTGRDIGHAIEVHRHLGPGLLESAYQQCLCFERERAELSFKRQCRLPIKYKNFDLENRYQADVIVEDTFILEIKSVEHISSVHEAQLLIYMRLSGISLGLLLNFNTPVLKDGIRRRRF